MRGPRAKPRCVDGAWWPRIDRITNELMVLRRAASLPIEPADREHPHS
jgi:Family of unknown function (DUF5994)